MEVPFKPFGITFLDFYDFSSNTTDAFKTIKERYPGNDVVVMNIFNQILVDIIHPDIVQEFLSGESLPSYEKAVSPGKMLTEGLVMGEGTKWKMK